MDRRRILLDADPGIDDAIMMLYLAAEPTAEIVAVGSTHGNCSAAQAAHNALTILEVCGLDEVPVAVGAENPRGEASWSPHVHGKDGLGDAGVEPPQRSPSGEHAVDQLLRLSLERPGELDLIAVGAMTNLAMALERDPESLRRFRSVSILACYSRPPRPGDPVTVDANVYHDPVGADRLLASGIPLTVVPIDLTNYVVLEDDQIARIRQGTTPQARFAWRILPFYFTFYETLLGRWSARMHDPLVPGVLLDPTLVRATVERPIYVEPFETKHRAVGREEYDPALPSDRPPVRIVTEVEIRRFLDRMVDALVTPLGELPRLRSG